MADSLGETLFGCYNILMGSVVGIASSQLLSSPDLLYKGAGVLGIALGVGTIANTFYEYLIKDWMLYHSIEEPGKKLSKGYNSEV